MLYDRDIREPLFWFLETIYIKVRFFEEKNIGRSRADIFFATEDALYGVEIKSDADSYARLQRQVKDYDRFFDYNYAVVGASHGKHVTEHIPEHWGVIVCFPEDDDVGFEVMRKPKPNPKLDMKKKMSILWRRELDAVRDKCLKYKYSKMSKAQLSKKIIENCEEEKLNRLITEELFNRDYTTI